MSNEATFLKPHEETLFEFFDNADDAPKRYYTSEKRKNGELEIETGNSKQFMTLIMKNV